MKQGFFVQRYRFCAKFRLGTSYLFFLEEEETGEGKRSHDIQVQFLALVRNLGAGRINPLSVSTQLASSNAQHYFVPIFGSAPDFRMEFPLDDAFRLRLLLVCLGRADILVKPTFTPGRHHRLSFCLPILEGLCVPNHARMQWPLTR